MPAARTDYLNEGKQLETTGGKTVEAFDQLAVAGEIESRETRNRILKLRRQGFSVPDIVEVLAEGDDQGPVVHLTEKGIYRMLHRYIETLADEDAENADVLRRIENERLDIMQRRLERDATLSGPDNAGVRRRAMQQQLRVMERRAKLNGLDAPTKHKIEGEVDHNLIADPGHVRAVDDAFRKRHGGEVMELPAGDVIEE